MLIDEEIGEMSSSGFKQGRTDFLCDGVLEYIEKHGLYQ